MSVQSILFPIGNFTPNMASGWLLHHNYKTEFEGKHYHRTNNYLRYRQKEPSSKFKYRTITLDNEKGIKAIVEISKK
jgi:hypothetical protein